MILIPSRNRSDLAIRAIRSTLDAPSRDRVEILVSDNSTEESESEALSGFCRALKDPRVRYIRPPSPLSMARHWEWAFQQAIDRSDFSHLTLLADRRVYLRGALDELCAIIRDHPDHAIVTHSDTLYDDISPIRLDSKPCSSRLILVRAGSILAENAHARLEFMTLVPTPFVSMIPRRLFAQVKARFGNYCLSLAPDYCFGYRVLDLDSTIIIYDKVMSLMMGAARSNGYSFMRGVQNKDNADFVATNGGGAFRYSETPAPEILSGLNGIFHEYNFVKSEARSGKFPELEIPGYANTLRAEIETFSENRERRDRYIEILGRLHDVFSHPSLPTGPAGGGTPWSPQKSGWRRIRELRGHRPRRSVFPILIHEMRSMVERKMRELLHDERSRPIWRAMNKLFGLPLPLWMGRRGFSTVDEAIDFFNKRNFRSSDDLVRKVAHLRALAEMADVAAPGS